MTRADVAQTIPSFAQRIIDWQRAHGRHHLPWQASREPYGVWLSEIMLQQTQVVTVIGYYVRFLERFPSISDLATAHLDDVLALWSGLGYYSRARNLHRCAQLIMTEHGGKFPKSAEQLVALPGIGPSTAAAIAAFCFGQRISIMDANVQRVLGRYLAFSEDLAVQKNVSQIWDLANTLLPDREHQNAIATYTQALMDLGASICSVKQPACVQCPLQSDCQAYRLGRPTEFPVKIKKLKRSVQSIYLVWLVRADTAVWLEQRPTPGVWAGLYCLPLFDTANQANAWAEGQTTDAGEDLPTFKHVLTHKDLYLHIRRFQCVTPPLALGNKGRWAEPAHLVNIGLPAPIRRLLLA